MQEGDGLAEAAAWAMKELRFERLVADLVARLDEAPEQECDEAARRPA